MMAFASISPASSGTEAHAGAAGTGGVELAASEAARESLRRLGAGR